MFSLKRVLRSDHAATLWSRWSLSVLSVLLACAALSVPLHAQIIPWTTAAGGNFNAIANWNSGAGPIPVAANTAQFNIANTYAVTFNLSPTNAALAVGGSNVTFRPDTVASRTYTITGNASITGGSLTLAAPTSGSNTLALNIGGTLTVNPARSLTVNAGNDVTAAIFNLATNSAGTGTTTIDGSGSTFTVTGLSTLGLSGGVGNLTLQNDASASFSNMSMASSGVSGTSASVTVQSGADITSLGNLTLGIGGVAGQASTFTVTGTGSTVVQTGTATTTIGAVVNSTGVLEISSGGSFTTGTGLTTISSTGTIAIGTGTFNLKGNLTVSGGSFLQLGGTSPVLNWDPSRTITVNSGGQVNLAQSFQTPNAATINVTGTGSQFNVNSFPLITSNATINVSSGGTLSSSGFTLGTGIGSVSTLTVDGIGSGIAVFSGTSYAIGIDGGTASASFTNSATGIFPSTSTLSVGRSFFTDGASGTINVLSDSDLTLGSLIISNGTTTSGTITVSGTGSTITQLAASSLSIGSFGGPANTGQLNINTGGTFTTGTGNTNILPSGRVSVSGGTFNVNSNITISGGSMSLTSGAAFNWAPSKSLDILNGGTFAASSFSTPVSSLISVRDAGSKFTSAGSVGINFGSALSVFGGADVSVASFLDIGEDGNGTVLVEGPGSSLTVSTSSFSVLGTDGQGSLTIRDGASVSYGGSLRIAGNTGSSTGTINVESGGSLLVGSLQVGSNASDTSTATINVIAGAITTRPLSTLTIGRSFGSDPIDSVNISAGGTFTMGTGATIINTTGRLTLNAGTFNTGGTLSAAAPITLTAGSILTATTTTLDGGSSLSITDSNVTLGNLTLNGGTVSFVSGSLSFGGNLTVGIGGMLGNNLTLDFSRALALTGTTTINPQRQLTLSGGSLSTGSIVNSGAFNFTSGTLSLTSPSGFTIGTGGSLGSTVSASAGKTFNITGLTTINANGRLLIADGAFNALGGIANSGEIALSGLTPSLTGGLITNNQLIRGDGRIDNSLTNTATGEIRVQAGESLILTGPSLTNAGRIDAFGNATSVAEVTFASPLTNSASTGLISARNAQLRFNGGLTNGGSLALTSGTNDISGDINNLAGATLTVTGGAHTTFYDDVTQNGTLRVVRSGSTTSVAVFLGAFTGAGGATGGGDIFLEGDLRPGNSPAFVNFDANLALGPNSTTLIEIAGTADTTYDRVTVNGVFNLAGTLDVRFIDSFLPTGNAPTTFLILSASALVGDFSQTLLPTSGDRQWFLQRTPTSLSLSSFNVIPEPSSLTLLSPTLLLLTRLPRATSGARRRSL